ncbi:DUF4102 domain-containing protein [Denitromonas sp. IR12]|uniref:DUF4102 domain-containing protein n=1 Tax=Denitromonas iodatirespirans TaxID=2795389 RepID=A0A944DEL1_DENI1|nr:DUF4102 domain-containing protein [Denitromonas iodatirespirans]
MALTALEIKNAKQGMFADGNGLYLRVQPNGAKSWIFRYQIDARRWAWVLSMQRLRSTPALKLHYCGNKSQAVSIRSITAARQCWRRRAQRRPSR